MLMLMLIAMLMVMARCSQLIVAGIAFVAVCVAVAVDVV